MKNKTYWVSFADPEKENGNLGIVITDAPNEDKALRKLKKAGLSPGGQALFFEMPENEDAAAEIKRWGKDRLITRAELIAAGYQRVADCTEVEQTMIDLDPRVTMICEKHT